MLVLSALSWPCYHGSVRHVCALLCKVDGRALKCMKYLSAAGRPSQLLSLCRSFVTTPRPGGESIQGFLGVQIANHTIGDSTKHTVQFPCNSAKFEVIGAQI